MRVSPTRSCTIFVDLHRAGLIYKDKRLVNWDPHFETAISDLEVDQVEVQPGPNQGRLWRFRYPLDGGATYEHPTEHDEDGKPTAFETRDHIVVATTRPETMLGDTGVAVHPDDPRYRDLIGKHCVLPLVGRKIPIVGDTYADPETGSGAVKMTPAHDFNDFEVGKRQGPADDQHFFRPARISPSATTPPLTTTSRRTQTCLRSWRGSTVSRLARSF